MRRQTVIQAIMYSLMHSVLLALDLKKKKNTSLKINLTACVNVHVHIKCLVTCDGNIGSIVETLVL